jgi:hypothetical protein
MKVVAYELKSCYIIRACIEIEGVYKTMINHNKNIKRVMTLIFILGLTFTLVACGNQNAVPYGSVSDDAYVTFGDVTVSEKELYDKLRFQSADLLSTMIDEVVFAEAMTEVRQLIIDGDVFYNEFLDETINNAIFQQTDLDALNSLLDNSEARVLRSVEQYVDSLYLIDPSVDVDALYQDIVNMNPMFENYASIPELLDRYVLRAGQRYYAYNTLLLEVEDEDSTQFVEESDVVAYYKSNNEGRYDVEVLVVRFINLNEANAALYEVGLKSDARGNWYQVPDVRIVDPNNAGYVDLDDTSSEGYQHVVDILTDLDLLDDVIASRNASENLLSSQEFADYYARYSISTTRTSGASDVALPDSNVKAKFVEIYNLLNPATQIQVNNDGTISGITTEFDTTFTYDELNELNTTLRSHVYTTLTSEDRQDEEDANNPYSARVQTFGSSRYLIYKLSDDGDSQEDILVDDPETEDEDEIFNETATALYEELRAEIIDNKLTNTYVTNQVEARYEELTIDIFDPVIRAFFDQTFNYNGSDSNQDGDVVATIQDSTDVLADSDILVDDLFKRLSDRFGVNLSLDIVINKYFDAQDTYVITDEEFADFEEQFEEIIRQFSADQFVSNGFPASMGREEFLMLAFGVTSNAQAVKELYVYPELRAQYLEDYEAHFTNIYQAFTDLAALQYEAYKSTRVSHLLVYFDQDGDGSPDNPQEYLDTLDAATVTDIKEGLAELVADIYAQVGDFRSEAEAFTTLAELFNSSGRIERGSNTAPYDLQIELDYAKYRQLGFYLKYENISSAITNKSNFITNSSTLDQVFYDRAIQLHDFIVGDGIEDQVELPYIDMYDDFTFNALDIATQLDDVQSSFGWHFIVTTSVTDAPSAVYEATSDADERYTFELDGVTYNVYNEGPDNGGSDALTLNQVEYYVRQSLTDEGPSVPSAVSTAITNYLSPVLSRYQNTFMQREIIFRLLEDGLNFASEANNVRFDIIRNINYNQLNEYLLSDVAYFDENYEALYATWFDLLEQ